MDYRYCWVSLVMVCMLLLAMAGCPAAVVGDAGSDYLDLKQAQVQQMATQAVQNYNRQCGDVLRLVADMSHRFELLATCNNPSNCSHDVCAPLLGDRDDLKCMTVNTNRYCSMPGTNNTLCTSLNLDYTRGYVRVAATTNLRSVDTMLLICAQRELDPLMISSALLNASIVTRFFFAPMDGSWRVIPGSAQTGDDCMDYEPRLRPWFRTATSVMKVVTVLIDTGASMNSVLPPSFGVTGTMLEAAKSIATQLLITLSADDLVNIVVFNSSGAYQLNPQAILVQEHSSTDQPELQPLLDELNGTTVESQFGQSNLTAAILTALPNFQSNSLAAKVILVITDGMFATLGNVTLPSASSLSGVKIFLYKLLQNNDNDIYLTNNTALIQQLCTVGGHFEPILKNLENPLLALNKFFSYLANLKRIEIGGVPQFSSIYQDFVQIGGNTVTVTQPAFSAAGDLIGVAGLTIYIGSLGNLTNPVQNALVSRVTGYSAPTNPIVLTSANCSIVNETTGQITAQPCGGNSALYYAANGGLCEQTDFRSTIQDLTCCGACSAPKRSGNLHQKGPIAGIVIGSLVGCVLLVSFGLCARRGYHIRKERRAAADTWMTKEFPGDIVQR